MKTHKNHTFGICSSHQHKHPSIPADHEENVNKFNLFEKCWLTLA